MLEAKPMDKQSEQRLLDAVRDVSAHVESGCSPTEAVVKSAQYHNLGRDMVPLVVQAYNVGRTTYQQSTGDGILDKQADFPIAHLEDALSQLYPKNPVTPGQAKSATAVSSLYDRAPDFVPAEHSSFEKVAHTIDIRMPEEGRVLPHQQAVDDRLSVKIAKAYRKIENQKKALDEAGSRYRQTRDAYLGALGTLRDYFKQAAFLRKPFDEVEYNSVLIFGEPARHAMDYAHVSGHLKESRAKDSPPIGLSRANPNEQPYSIVKAAIDLGAKLLVARRELSRLEKISEAVVNESLRPFCNAPGMNQSPSILGAFAQSSIRTEKEAGLLGSAAMMGAGAAVRGVGSSDPNAAVMNAEQQLSDPDHVSTLREIETRAMLQDMMMNDEVISGYDPEEILMAYNEIAQLSPRASAQPAVIRPLLRKRLTQGAMEPFEAQQMADIEKTISQTANQQDESIAPNPALSKVPGSGGASNVLGGNSLFA